MLAVRTALPELSLGCDNVKVVEVHGHGPGNALLLDLEFEHSTELICAFGARQKSAEAVAAEVVADARIFLDAAVPVGAHLADQLLIPLALGGGCGGRRDNQWVDSGTSGRRCSVGADGRVDDLGVIADRRAGRP